MRPGRLDRRAQRAIHDAVASLAIDLDRAFEASSPWAFEQSRSVLLRLLAVEIAARTGYLPAVRVGVPSQWDEFLARCRRLDTALPDIGFPALSLDVRLVDAHPGPETLTRLRTAVDSLPNGGAGSHAVLSAVYQHLARYRAESHSGRLCLVASSASRKQHGQFYTPLPVAEMVASAALAALPAATRLQPCILDPAMGTGVFLLAAVRSLAALHPANEPAQIAETCLFGVDIDPVACALAVIGLWLETGASPAILAANLRTGDLLQQATWCTTFDLVLGNPPWGTAAQAGCAGDLMNVRARTVDSFKLFLDLGLHLTHGALGMVVPQAVLAQTTHADIRSRLLHRLDAYWVAPLGDGVFAGAAAPACALVFGPRPGPSTLTVRDARRRKLGVADQSMEYRVPASCWTAAGFPVGPAEPRALLQRLQTAHPCLGDLGDRFSICDGGINYNRAEVARRSLYRAERAVDPRDLPCYRGRDFGRFTAIQRSGWLRHDAQLRLQPGEQLAYSRSLTQRQEKLVFRQTADCLIGSLDRTGMIMGRSVIGITAEAEGSLHALLGCLNSRLLTLLYRALAEEEGRILPQVKVARLRALPIPAVAGRIVDQTDALDEGCAPGASPQIIGENRFSRGRPGYPLGVSAAPPSSQTTWAIGVPGAEAEGHCFQRSLPTESTLSQIPAVYSAASSASLWVRLDAAVSSILNAGGDLPDAIVEVDHLVYELYGLSEEEIGVVDRYCRTDSQNRWELHTEPSTGSAVE